MAYEIVPDGNGGEVFVDRDVKPQVVAEPVVNTPSTVAPQSGGYTPQDIADVYEVLAPMAGDYANANIERAGQAQASYGPLAEAAMGGSRTAGIGNYTYNRLARPAVDTMRDELIVQGYSDALNRQLSETLRQAQENYSRASRRYGLNNSNGSNKNTNPQDNGDVSIEDEYVPGTPTVLPNSYTIIDKDGKSKTYTRPAVIKDDVEWYKWVERERQKAEEAGGKFILGGN